MTARAIFRRVEHRKVSTDGLLGRVAFEPLGAAVPRHDAPVAIEHEDRVFADRVDHEVEPGLALAKHFELVPALADVAHHDAETREAAVGVAKGGGDDLGGERFASASKPRALDLASPVTRRELEVAARCARGDLVFGIKDRHRSTERILGGTIEEALRSDVPRGDPPVRLEQEHRAIDHAVDEEPKSFIIRAGQSLTHGAIAASSIPSFRTRRASTSRAWFLRAVLD
jgi:hypothetical protein